MLKVSLFLVLIMFLVCCKTNQISLKEGNNVLHYQKPNLLDKKSQTFITLAKVEDGRCPEDVNCIWAGLVNVNLEFDLRNLKKKENLNLCFGCLTLKDSSRATPSESDINLEGTKYHVKLLGVRPNPNTKSPPKIENYEVSIQIDKL